MPVAMSAADLDPFGCLPVKGAIPDQELDHADGRRGEYQCRKAKQICAVGKSYIRINEIA